jgi:hypothetical protein
LSEKVWHCVLISHFSHHWWLKLKTNFVCYEFQISEITGVF